MALTQITEKGIKDGEIVNADINASAAIQGSKISPDFGSQNITTTGRVLVGTTTEGGVNADDLTIATSGHTGITIRTGTSSVGSLYFSDGTSGDDEYRGVVQYNHTDNFLRFYSDAAERMRIDSSGNVGIGVTPTMAAGGGLHVRGPSGHQARLHMTTSNSGDTGNDGFYIIQQGAESTSNDTNFINYETANMKFSTSGSERMRIDSSGRVLIGKTSTSQTHPLQIQADSNAQAIAIYGRSSDDIGEIAYWENDGTTKLGELQYRTNEVNFRHRAEGASINFATTASGGTVTERMRIDSSGTLCIGTTSSHATGKSLSISDSDHAIEVYITSSNSAVRGLTLRHAAAQGTTDADQIVFENIDGDAVGFIKTRGSSTSYNTSSDYRLKENVVSISDGITRLKTLKPSRFNFKANSSNVVDGFLAHEVTAVPEAISGSKDEVDENNNPVYQGIDQSKLVPLLTAALQEAIAKIEVLETKVAALEAG